MGNGISGGVKSAYVASLSRLQRIPYHLKKTNHVIEIQLKPCCGTTRSLVVNYRGKSRKTGVWPIIATLCFDNKIIIIMKTVFKMGAP